MKIRIHHITPSSFVDGPGERSVLFAQGCPRRCPDCHNRALCAPQTGRPEEVEQVAKTLALLSEKHGNVSLSGGEVFAQPAALAQLVTLLRKYGTAHILVSTCYTWEELLSPAGCLYPWAREVFEHCDILVDDYRRRPLDVAASLEAGQPAPLERSAPVAAPAPVFSRFRQVAPASPAAH